MTSYSALSSIASETGSVRPMNTWTLGGQNWLISVYTSRSLDGAAFGMRWTLMRRNSSFDWATDGRNCFVALRSGWPPEDVAGLRLIEFPKRGVVREQDMSKQQHGKWTDDKQLFWAGGWGSSRTEAAAKRRNAG